MIVPVISLFRLIKDIIGPMLLENGLFSYDGAAIGHDFEIFSNEISPCSSEIAHGLTDALRCKCFKHYRISV